MVQIPSAYGRERLDVLRRLEQLKELESENEGSDIEERASRQLNKSSSGSKLDESWNTRLFFNQSAGAPLKVEHPSLIAL